MKKFSFMIILLAVLLLPLKIKARSDIITVTLNKCVDGDTAWFNYNDERMKVRFLGINTMELKSDNNYAKIAADYTCESLTNAKEIKLEFDPKSDEKDKYNRYLAWVFVDNMLLESDLVEKGYAEVKYIYDDYKYVDDLYQKENKAKKEKLGIWKDSKEDNNYSEYIYIGIASICILLGISTTKIKKIKKLIVK